MILGSEGHFHPEGFIYFVQIDTFSNQFASDVAGQSEFASVPMSTCVFPIYATTCLQNRLCVRIRFKTCFMLTNKV